ncbi:hypothetical protein [Citrobacter freundii]|uniref:hypothetical protein n=1 Tax=Citrobacter freundii TaxID=546 RepID=UPI003879AE90
MARHAKDYLIVLFLVTITYNTVAVPVLQAFDIKAPKMILISEEQIKTFGTLLMSGVN